VPKDLKGRTAAIIATDEFEDLELFHPMYRMQEEGIRTIVIGLTKDPIKGKNGYSITPNASIDDVNAEKFDFRWFQEASRLSSCDSTARSSDL
jgi:protease I